MADNSTVKMESLEDFKTPEGAVKLWQEEIRAAERELERFWKRCDIINQLYLDEEREMLSQELSSEELRRVNLFWSNVQVLKSTLYTRPPKIDVSRRFKDYMDDVGRVAGEMLERILNTDLERDNSDFDVAVRNGIDDWLRVGLGQLWYRYEVQTQQVERPPVLDPATGAELAAALSYEEVMSEDALSDYVHWRDFLWSPARTWEEVRWVGRRVRMTRDAGVKRFGEKFKLVALDNANTKRDDSTTPAYTRNDPWARAEVFEIWCKEDRQVRWLARGFDQMLDEKPDPLKLERFFPCPRPLLATTTTSSLVPRADYSMAQDQYSQVNELATRISMLVRACKVVGVYDRAAEGVQRMLKQGVENDLIPVDNWAAFAEKGGIKGAVNFLPLEDIVLVVAKLREDMAAQKEQLYETLGLADIMRGITRATETATAQQIKAQYGSTRLQYKQFDVASWVRSGQQIKAEIICMHFQPKTLKERSNIEQTPDARLADQAIALLKSKWSYAYRLTIEADSMAALDWAAEREARTQFIQAVGDFIQRITPLVQAAPQAAPILMQLLQWAVQGFRVGKTIEGVLDQAMNRLTQSASQPPQPDPKQDAEVANIKADTAQKGSAAVKNIAQARAAAMPGMPGAPIGPPGLAAAPGIGEAGPGAPNLNPTGGLA